MIKTLYYYLYVGADFETNQANMCHKILLSRYIHCFDTLKFFLAVDDFENNIMDVARGITWIKNVCKDRVFSVTVLPNDTKRRETKVLIDYVLPNVDDYKNEAIFLGHNKGVTNMSNKNLDNESVLRWIMAMYWYNLEYIDDVDTSFKQGKVFYGSLKANFVVRNGGAKLVSGGFMYPGTFYWVMPSRIKENLKVPMEDVFNKANMWVTEDFPMCFNEKLLGSHNDVRFIDRELNPYKGNASEWRGVYSRYGDEEALMNMQELTFKLLKKD